MIMDRDKRREHPRRRRTAEEHNRHYRPGRYPYPEPADHRGTQNRDWERGDNRGGANG